MKAVTLFSGIGGFDIALESSGVEVDSVCEIDKNAQSVLRRHFPNSKLYDDVRKVGLQTHAKRSVEIICGGFPCQDLSIAGKRKGLDGERSGLWFEFARIIDELEPQWVVIENVPGLLSSDRGGDFAIILQWLAQRGYCVAWRVLDAQYFGVPQRRRRVFVVASFGNGRAAEVLFEQESMSGNTPPSRETGQGIADTFTIRSGKEGGGKGYLGQESLAMTLGGQEQYLASGKDVAPTLCATYATKWGLGDQEAFSGDYHVISSGQANASIDKNISPPLTTVMENGNAPIIFPTLTSRYGKGVGMNNADNGIILDDQGGSQMSISKDIVPTLGASVHGHQPLVAWEMQHASEAYRETQGGIATSVQSRMGTGGNNVPLVGIRRLTPLECERLQGFPDGWTDGQSDSARYKQLGNAVAVPVVEWIIKRIVEANNA